MDELLTEALLARLDAAIAGGLPLAELAGWLDASRRDLAAHPNPVVRFLARRAGFVLAGRLVGPSADAEARAALRRLRADTGHVR